MMLATLRTNRKPNLLSITFSQLPLCLEATAPLKTFLQGFTPNGYVNYIQQILEMIIFVIQLSQSWKERLKEAVPFASCVLRESTLCSIWCSFIVFILEPTHKAPFHSPPWPPNQLKGNNTIKCPRRTAHSIERMSGLWLLHNHNVPNGRLFFYWCQGILLKHVRKKKILWMNFPFWHLCPD